MTQISNGTQSGRELGAAYILFIALLTVPITVFRALHPNGWTPGDWLVNYEGGFVRRGLPGETILLVAHGLHLSPLLLGSFLPLLFYVLLYFVVWQLYRRSSGDLWTFAALVSPATLAFPVLDPVGAFRKELILLVALASLLLWIVRRPSPNVVLLIVFLTLTGTICTLSHEGLLPFLLYLLGALWMGLGDLRRAVKIAVIPVLATAGTLLAVLHHRGNALEEQTICRSLGAAPPIVCSGSIAYLAKGTNVARADVIRNIHAYHYLFYYPMVALLGLLPLAALGYRLAKDRSVKRDVLVVIGTSAVALLASLPLFVYAMDWGRWIYIHILSVFLLLLFLDIREQRLGLAAPGIANQRVPKPVYVSYQPWWVLAVLLIYATCWNIPHFGNYPKKGYLNVPIHMLGEELHNRHRRPASVDTAAALVPRAARVAHRVP